MSKHTKTFIIIGAVIVIAVAVYFFVTKKASAATTATQTKKGGSPIDSAINKLSNVVGLSTDKFPLKVGSRGANVENLQSALNDLMTFSLSNETSSPDYVPLTVDGDFGNLTLQAVQLYYGDANKTEVTESDYTELQSKLGTGYASAPDPQFERDLGRLFNQAILHDSMTTQWTDNILNMHVENAGV